MTTLLFAPHLLDLGKAAAAVIEKTKQVEVRTRQEPRERG